MDESNPNPNDKPKEHEGADSELPVSLMQGSYDENNDTNAPDEDTRMSKIIEKIKESAAACGRLVWHYLRKPSFTDWVVGIATVVIAIATWKTYREVQQGGQQTTQIVTAAQQIQEALDTANIRNGRAFRRTLEQSREAMNENNVQSKEVLDATIAQNRLDQRAFVNFGKIMQDNPVIIAGKNDVQDWEFRPRLANSGNTPTRNAKVHASFLYFSAVLPDNFTFPDLGPPIPSYPFALGPKEQDVTGPLLTIPVSVLQDVKDKTKHIYFWGWLTYQDVFPKTPSHISMFCMELTDVRGALVPGTSYQFNWSLCPRHNCADDECKDEPYGTPNKIWPN